jgi:signal transduction histidine kinase
VKVSWSRRFAGEVFVVSLAIAVDLVAWGGDRLLRSGEILPLWVVPALTIGIYGSLLFRWRWPVGLFTVQWLYALAGLIIPRYVPFACLLVGLHAVACRRPARISATAFAACAVPFGIDSYNAASLSKHGTFFGNFTAASLILFASATCAWMLGRRTYLADRRARVALETHAHEAAEAVRTERLRLARELHDIVAHAVSAIILQAAGARTLVKTEDRRVRQAFTVIESAGVQAMNELHRLLGLLRTVDPDRTAGTDFDAQQPGLEDLPALVDFSRASGLDVSLVVEGRRARLDRSVDLAAYRVIQEALTNATKHGGRTVNVHVHYVLPEQQVSIEVRNLRESSRPATTADSLSSGHGLIGLAERVSLVGGRLEAGPVGDGFLVRAELPLNKPGRVSGDAVAPGDEDW